MKICDAENYGKICVDGVSMRNQYEGTGEVQEIVLGIKCELVMSMATEVRTTKNEAKW